MESELRRKLPDGWKYMTPKELEIWSQIGELPVRPIPSINRHDMQEILDGRRPWPIKCTVSPVPDTLEGISIFILDPDRITNEELIQEREKFAERVRQRIKFQIDSERSN